ncbi:MAG: flagellin-like hook-associated protein FlgL, partial [Myxococcota bacterium]
TLSRNVSALEAEVAAEGRISDQSHAVAATALAAAQLQQQSIIGAAAIARKLSREQAERLLS